MKIEVDFGLCESNGMCMGIIPDVFQLGEDDQLTVLRTGVTQETEGPVRQAIRQCPRQAISIVDEHDPER